MQNIILTSDSTTDLSPELIERYGLKIAPLFVDLGGETLKDGVDVGPDDVFAYVQRTGKLPKTAAVNIADYTDFFAQYAKDGNAVLHFTISSEMSSTYQNACLAASEFDNVYVVDTRNLSTGGGLLVVLAAELIEKGEPAERIAEICRETASRVDASFVLDTLTYMVKGGRCSMVEALGANLLHIKPCIAVKNGTMGMERKFRGKLLPVLKQYIESRLSDPDDIVTDHVFITHSGLGEDVIEACIQTALSCVPFKEVHITRAGCTISSHCGENCLGILFIRKTDLK